MSKLFEQFQFGTWTYKRSMQKIAFSGPIPGKPPFFEDSLPVFLDLLAIDDQKIVLQILNGDQSPPTVNLTVSLLKNSTPVGLTFVGTWNSSHNTVQGIFYSNTNNQPMPRDVARNMNVLKVISEISSFIIYEQDFEAERNVRYSGMHSILGYSPEEYAEDVNWWIGIIHPDDRPVILNRFYTLIPGTTNIVMNYRVRHKDGHYIYIHDRSRIEWDGEKIKYMIGCAENVTEKLLAERAIFAAKEAAEAANQTKTNFLSNMSHELRTPLGAIVGFSELVQAGDIEPKIRSEYLDTILRNALHLADVVSTIIDVSRIESGEVNIRQDTVDLRALIENIGTRFTRKAGQSGLTLTISKSDYLPAEFVCDKAKLRQILSSVIGNALKFTKTGSVAVRFKVEEDSELLLVQVQDTGIGIPEDHKESIFDHFTQVDYSSVRTYGGTGLGLALARNFARQIGGDVILTQTVVGIGSTFEIQIPLNPALQRDHSSRFSTAKLEIIPASKKQIFLGKKFLVIEDIEDNFLLVKAILQSLGASIEWSEHGFDALEKVRANSSYDLIIMDIGIPGIDGLNLTRILRHEGTSCPIIALSAHVMPDTIRQALEAGCNKYLGKPIEFDKFVGTISELLLTAT